MKQTAALFLILLAAGCATASGGRATLPYRAWSIGYIAPAYMEVWIETIDVEDVRGRVFRRIGSGTASIDYHGDAAGWGKTIGLGGGREVTGAALPKRLYVRWQSLVEPQTYRATLEIPEKARRLMLTKEEGEYREFLVLGLAPGGDVKAWVNGARSDAIEVLCTRAEIEPKGPSQGLNEGRYAYSFDKLEPATQRYLKTHEVPYGSWDCGKWPSYSAADRVKSNR